MYYYSSGAQVNTNGTANTDTLLFSIKTDGTTTKMRASVCKLWAGSYQAPSDNAVRLRLTRLTTFGSYADGSALVPQLSGVDQPAANAVCSTTATLGTGVLATVYPVQLAFNQRGTAMWAAFTDDEKVTFTGPNNAINGLLLLNSQATVATLPVNINVVHEE